MSRLTECDIEKVSDFLSQTDKISVDLIGLRLSEIASNAVVLSAKPKHKKCGVVPVTSGLGVISNFSETVVSILKYLGAEAFVTKKTDISGIAEAYEKNADIIFAADDDTFSAICTRKQYISDNGKSTGIGFAEALCSVYKKDSEILVIGAGPVGRAAAKYIGGKGFPVCLFDNNPDKLSDFSEAGNVKILKNCDFSEYKYILCAANTGGFITSSDVDKKTFISAPGMPLCVDEEALKAVTLFHNPLELGVAVMYYDCLKVLLDE
jgi:pyrrolysine biosynthesis protein PylD